MANTRIALRDVALEHLIEAKSAGFTTVGFNEKYGLVYGKKHDILFDTLDIDEAIRCHKNMYHCRNCKHEIQGEIPDKCFNCVKYSNFERKKFEDEEDKA